MEAGWIDANGAQEPLRHELDDRLALPDHGVVALMIEKKVEGLEPDLRLRQVVSGQMPRVHSSMASPKAQSSFRIQ